MIRHVLFGLAVLAQVAILAVKPAEKLIIRHVTGRVITLRTKPVDPYDVMRGYYMTLGYEISDPPGFNHLERNRGNKVYTLLEKGNDGVWNAVSVSDELPVNLSANQAVIRGFMTARHSDGPIRYGIEQYFVPEEMRHQIENKIRKAGERILVDVAVDPKGRSSLLRLRVGNETYEY